MKEIVIERVKALRLYMQHNNLSAFIFPSTDPHYSEYPPEHWKIREWISGFNGSAGTAVVTLNDAALWTDSRYFLAAAEQLKDTPFRLMKECVAGTPSITQWLANVLPAGSVIGIDGWCSSAEEVQRLSKELEQNGLHLVISENPSDTLWTSRPSLPESPVRIQPLEYAGRDINEKLI